VIFFTPVGLLILWQRHQNWHRYSFCVVQIFSDIGPSEICLFSGKIRNGRRRPPTWSWLLFWIWEGCHGCIHTFPHRAKISCWHKGPDIYILVPLLTGKPEQQRFTVQNGVLTSISSRQRSAAQLAVAN